MSLPARNLTWYFGSAILTCILSFGVGVFAEPPKYPKTVPELIQRIGSPLQIKWKDGRTATLFQGKGVYFNPVTDLNMIENSCTNLKKLKCVHTGSQFMRIYEVRWTEHPDPQRVGKPVILKISDDKPGFELNQGFFLLGVAHLVAKHPLTGPMQMDRMVCDSMDWIDQAKMNHVDTLEVLQMSSEFMFPNDESGQSENRTVNSVINARFSIDRSDSKSPVLSLLGYDDFLESPFFLGGNIIIGDVFRMDLKLKADTSCSVAFKPNSTGKEFGDALGESMSAFEPYLYEAHEFYRESAISNFITFTNGEEIYAAE